MPLKFSAFMTAEGGSLQGGRKNISGSGRQAPPAGGFQVVLVEPEIPSNTGNIGRTCVASNSELHLVAPLGFEISDKRLKRAGLDYWPLLKCRVYESFRQWEKSRPPAPQTLFFSTKGKRSLYETAIQPGAALVFGRETYGLGEEILAQYREQTVAIPFPGPARSLNLANAAAVAVFEALRQNQPAA